MSSWTMSRRQCGASDTVWSRRETGNGEQLAGREADAEMLLLVLLPGRWRSREIGESGQKATVGRKEGSRIRRWDDKVFVEQKPGQQRTPHYPISGLCGLPEASLVRVTRRTACSLAPLHRNHQPLRNPLQPASAEPGAHASGWPKPNHYSHFLQILQGPAVIYPTLGNLHGSRARPAILAAFFCLLWPSFTCMAEVKKIDLVLVCRFCHIPMNLFLTCISHLFTSLA